MSSNAPGEQTVHIVPEPGLIGKPHDEQFDSVFVKKIPVMEMFGPVLQGEGAMIGVQTFFVRLGGCDYRCKLCDSLHAVLPDKVHEGARRITPREAAHEVITEMRKYNTHWVTLSGGNPAMYDMYDFVRIVHDHDLRVAVETQGSIWRDWLGDVDQLTISPKGPGMIDDWQEQLEVVERFVLAYTFARSQRAWKGAYCFKIPVFGEQDLVFAKQVKLRFGGKLYLSVGNNDIPMNHEGQELTRLPNASQRDTLLHSLVAMSDMVMRNHPELSDAVILPQLHVLCFGNQKGK